MVGTKDKNLSEQLQLDSKLTLEKAITKNRQSETMKKQQTYLQETKSDPPLAHILTVCPKEREKIPKKI